MVTEVFVCCLEFGLQKLKVFAPKLYLEFFQVVGWLGFGFATDAVVVLILQITKLWLEGARL